MTSLQPVQLNLLNIADRGALIFSLKWRLEPCEMGITLTDCVSTLAIQINPSSSADSARSHASSDSMFSGGLCFAQWMLCVSQTPIQL